jgi:SAM-dependent methyltransferase
VLDVGTGTGIVALEAARRIEPNARIVGIDLSDGLLGSARRKNQFGQRVSFLKMDAENVGLKTGSFDAVLSLFALLHFPDPGRALGEMFRVLRPGGVATIAFGSGPPWLSLTGVRHRIERIPDVMQLALGRLLIGPGFLDRLLRNMYPADSGGEESELARRSHVRGPHVVPLMHAAGFSAVSSYWRGYQYSFDDPERFWVLQRVYSSFSRKRLAALSAADRDAAKRAFMERCNRVLARRGRLVYPYAVMFVSGRKA